MADKEKEKGNLLVLSSFLLDGEHQPVGRVLAKSAFSVKSDWQNILFMETPLVRETDDAAGDPEATVATMPGAKKATR